jgi:hypothetical protein
LSDNTLSDEEKQIRLENLFMMSMKGSSIASIIPSASPIISSRISSSSSTSITPTIITANIPSPSPSSPSPSSPSLLPSDIPSILMIDEARSNDSPIAEVENTTDESETDQPTFSPPTLPPTSSPSVRPTIIVSSAITESLSSTSESDSAMTIEAKTNSPTYEVEYTITDVVPISQPSLRLRVPVTSSPSAVPSAVPSIKETSESINLELDLNDEDELNHPYVNEWSLERISNNGSVNNNDGAEQNNNNAIVTMISDGRLNVEFLFRVERDNDNNVVLDDSTEITTRLELYKYGECETGELLLRWYDENTRGAFENAVSSDSSTFLYATNIEIDRENESFLFTDGNENEDLTASFCLRINIVALNNDGKMKELLLDQYEANVMVNIPSLSTNAFLVGNQVDPVKPKVIQSDTISFAIVYDVIACLCNSDYICSSGNEALRPGSYLRLCIEAIDNNNNADNAYDQQNNNNNIEVESIREWTLEQQQTTTRSTGGAVRRAIFNGEPDDLTLVEYVNVQQKTIAVISTPLDAAFFVTPNIPVTVTGVVRLKRKDNINSSGESRRQLRYRERALEATTRDDDDDGGGIIHDSQSNNPTNIFNHNIASDVLPSNNNNNNNNEVEEGGEFSLQLSLLDNINNSSTTSLPSSMSTLQQPAGWIVAILLLLGLVLIPIMCYVMYTCFYRDTSRVVQGEGEEEKFKSSNA